MGHQDRKHTKEDRKHTDEVRDHANEVSNTAEKVDQSEVREHDIEIRDYDIIARVMRDGKFRLASYLKKSDVPLINEPALERHAAESRARKMAEGRQCRGWIEDAPGVLRL